MKLSDLSKLWTTLSKILKFQRHFLVSKIGWIFPFFLWRIFDWDTNLYLWFFLKTLTFKKVLYFLKMCPICWKVWIHTSEIVGWFILINSQARCSGSREMSGRQTGYTVFESSTGLSNSVKDSLWNILLAKENQIIVNLILKSFLHLSKLGLKSRNILANLCIKDWVV